MDYYFATSNKGKLKEVNALLAENNITAKPLPDFGETFEAVEDAETFEGNAIAKAAQTLEWLRAHNITDAAVLADDSGLCVDALNGEPGVYSARYWGADTSYEIKNRHIINLLAGTQEDKRTARFTCVIACAFPDGRVLTAEGSVEGVIAWEPRGEGGFGYDPIFYLPEYGKTAAELPFEVKNSISHRGRALRKICTSLF